MNQPEQAALNLSEGLGPTAGNLARVAKATSESVARWAFEQWSLRKRAKTKFARAAEMLFDTEALEMATGEIVAHYHASKFPSGVLVVDLTCGIGADLIALAGRGPATGLEMDPVRAEIARHNLSVHGLRAEVAVGDCLRQDWEAEYAFCDPARRRAGRRTLDIDEFSPNPRLVAERFRELELGGMKLSPMLSDHDLESLGGDLEFISYGGECREALIWISRSRSSGARRAIHVETGSSIDAGKDPISTESPAGFIYEADPAAIRAHCLGEICSQNNLCALADSNGYLTGDKLIGSPWLTGYTVLRHHSADLKRTRLALKDLGGGTPVVKCRGVQIDVDRLRKDLRGPGNELVVMVYSVGRSLQHAICRRVDN